MEQARWLLIFISVLEFLFLSKPNKLRPLKITYGPNIFIIPY